MNAQTFSDLIDQINKAGGDVQRERGALFEKVVLGYLKHEATYRDLYQNVWLLSDVPDNYSISNKIMG